MDKTLVRWIWIFIGFVILGYIWNQQSNADKQLWKSRGVFILEEGKKLINQL